MARFNQLNRDEAVRTRALGNTPEVNARRAATQRTNHAVRKANRPITEQLINELHNMVIEEVENGDGTKSTIEMTKMRRVVKSLVSNAIKGDMLAIKEVFDRVEGKAHQQVDVTHDGDVSVRSAALSFLDQVIADVLRADAVRVDANVVPERPVLPAPLHLPAERSGEPVDICEVPGGSGEP